MEIKNGVQGGSNLYFTTEDGTEISFEGSLGARERRIIFGDRVLTQLEVENREDLAKFGLDFDTQKPHLDPFSPAPKGPSR